jgi:hypothetical protein
MQATAALAALQPTSVFYHPAHQLRVNTKSSIRNVTDEPANNNQWCVVKGEFSFYRCADYRQMNNATGTPHSVLLRSSSTAACRSAESQLYVWW